MRDPYDAFTGLDEPAADHRPECPDCGGYADAPLDARVECATCRPHPSPPLGVPADAALDVEF